MSHQCPLAGFEGSLRCEVFRGIRVGTTRQSLVISPGCAQYQQPASFKFNPGTGQGVLDSLVLPDRSAKNHPFFGVALGPIQGIAPDSDCLGSDQDPLRVEAVQKVAKALAFLANTILNRNHQAVNEKLVRIHGLAPHLVDFTYLDALPIKISIEQCQPVDRGHVGGAWGSARQQH